MRRERSPSGDGRARWDNPTGQLPGAGTPSGIDSGLYGTLRRRTRLRSLGNDGAVSSLGETRPSLFSGIPESFSPFGAVNRIGASGGISSGIVEIMPRF